MLPTPAGLRRQQVVQGKRRSGFQSPQRDGAAHLLDDREIEQLVEKKALIVLEVAGDDLKQIVDLARDHVAGDDFGESDNRRLEGGGAIVGMAVDFHADEDGEAEPDPLAPKHGAIGFDVAFAPQPMDAPEARRRRQADALGEVGVAQPAVGLERGDDPAVNGIERRFWHIRPILAPKKAYSCKDYGIFGSIRKDMPRRTVRCSAMERRGGPRRRRQDMPSTTTPEEESESFAAPEAIAATLQIYIDAARAGEGSLMRRAFAEGARIRGSYGGKPVDWTLEEFCDIIDQGGPAAALEARIVAIDLAGNIAMARLEARNWRGTRYTDFFHLIKQAGGWQIAGKLFFAHSRA